MENNRNALQVSLNQLQSELNQIDEIFAEYLSGSNSYAYLSKITEKEPIDTFLEHQMETMNWMNSQISMHTNVKGGCVL